MERREQKSPYDFSDSDHDTDSADIKSKYMLPPKKQG